MPHLIQDGTSSAAYVVDIKNPDLGTITCEQSVRPVLATLKGKQYPLKLFKLSSFYVKYTEAMELFILIISGLSFLITHTTAVFNGTIFCSSPTFTL